MPYKPDLSAFLFEPTFKVLAGPALHAKMDLICKLGNSAVHSTRSVSVPGALAVSWHCQRLIFKSLNACWSPVA
ncbi:MAG: hypothetical protein EON92_10900 [Burkholderiales bacterium]|nr:MAG: hypothetical protein EON92_10900 [Burkholderiales bacterium]